MADFGSWGNPGGGFNWDMLTNVGAGMLANSQWGPATAFGKGYGQAQQNNLEAAKAQLMFQDYDLKRKQQLQHQKDVQDFLKRFGGGQGGAEAQPAPQAGAMLQAPPSNGMEQFPNTAQTVGMPQTAAPPPQAAPQGGPVPQPGGFDAQRFQQLGQYGAGMEALQDPSTAAAARMLQGNMSTLNDIQNKSGTLDVQRQHLTLDKQAADRAAQKQQWEMTGGPQDVEHFKKELYNVQDASVKAQSSNATLGVLKDLTQKPGFYSGWGADTVMQAKRALTALGVQGAEGVKDIESFRTIVNQGILDKAGGSLGNQISNGDRTIIQGMLANLENTPQGNRQIIDILSKMNQRNIEVARMARDYAKGHNNNLDLGWYDKLDKFTSENPLFPPSNTTPTANPGPVYTPGKKIQWGQ